LGKPLSDKHLTPKFDISTITPEYEVYEDDNSTLVPIPEVDSVVNVSDYDPDIYDGYIMAQVLLPKSFG
jgi:hypothetical protein